jgi:hypothetical protein
MGDIMTAEKPRHEKRLKRSAISGIAIGALAILACELPIILGLVGLGALSGAANILKPPPLVELAALIIIGAGVSVLLYMLVRRFNKFRKRA